jgi:hypothetical protein
MANGNVFLLISPRGTNCQFLQATYLKAFGIKSLLFTFSADTTWKNTTDLFKVLPNTCIRTMNNLADLGEKMGADPTSTKPPAF